MYVLLACIFIVTIIFINVFAFHWSIMINRRWSVARNIDWAIANSTKVGRLLEPSLIPFICISIAGIIPVLRALFLHLEKLLHTGAATSCQIGINRLTGHSHHPDGTVCRWKNYRSENSDRCHT